jgi:riboflavin biosynthesis pyrimidine reductase
VRLLWPEPGAIDDVAGFVAAEARPTPVGRPWLLVNMIASLDGAISVEGRSGGLGAPADKAMFAALRGAADVILVGAGTARTEGYGPPRPSDAVRAARSARGQVPAPRLALVSRSLGLDPSARCFAEAEERPYVICPATAPAERMEALAAVAHVVALGDDEVDLSRALGRLGDDGAGIVTCEGGPSLNADLIAHDLVDEWALTLSPLLVGGDSARSSTGAPSPDPRQFELARLAEGDGLLLSRWLRARSR